VLKVPVELAPPSSRNRLDLFRRQFYFKRLELFLLSAVVTRRAVFSASRPNMQTDPEIASYEDGTQGWNIAHSRYDDTTRVLLRPQQEHLPGRHLVAFCDPLDDGVNRPAGHTKQRRLRPVRLDVDVVFLLKRDEPLDVGRVEYVRVILDLVDRGLDLSMSSLAR